MTMDGILCLLNLNLKGSYALSLLTMEPNWEDWYLHLWLKNCIGVLRTWSESTHRAYSVYTQSDKGFLSQGIPLPPKPLAKEIYSAERIKKKKKIDIISNLFIDDPKINIIYF